MGKALFQSDRQNADTASVRRWIGAWLQGMLDAGFVQTADTGQVDPETVEIDTGVQYAVFRFDDDLQATAPIFFKVGFETSSSSRKALSLSVGKSTNGAGTLAGVLYPEAEIGNISSNSSGGGVAQGLWEHLAASGDGWVVFNPFIREETSVGSTNKLYSGFIIERARGNNGELRSDALMVAHPSASNVTGTVSLASMSGMTISVSAIAYDTGFANAGVPPVIAPYSLNGGVLGSGGSLAAGSIGPVYPWDLVAPGLAPWRSCVIVSIPGGDLPGGVFETNLCGQVADFYPVAPNAAGQGRWGIAIAPNAATSVTASVSFGVGIRWED